MRTKVQVSKKNHTKCFLVNQCNDNWIIYTINFTLTDLHLKLWLREGIIENHSYSFVKGKKFIVVFEV